MRVKHFEVMKFIYPDRTCRAIIVPAITPAVARRMWRRYWHVQAKKHIERDFNVCRAEIETCSNHAEIEACLNHAEISIMTRVEACLKQAERAESMIFARRTVPNYRRASARQRARMKMWR